MTLTLGKQIPTANATERAAKLNWQCIAEELDEHGDAVLAQMLSAQECDEFAARYPHDQHFGSRVVMEGYGFGRGEYDTNISALPAVISVEDGPLSVFRRNRQSLKPGDGR